MGLSGLPVSGCLALPCSAQAGVPRPIRAHPPAASGERGTAGAPLTPPSPGPPIFDRKLCLSLCLLDSRSP